MAGYKVAGSGGTSTTAARVEWGPDFGEDNGSDGVTRRIGVQLRLPGLELENNKSVGVQLALPELAIANTKSVGVNLDLDSLAIENNKSVGVDLDLDSLAIENNKSIGVQLTLPNLVIENTKSVGVHLSGTALGAPNWQSQTNTATQTDATEVVVNKPADVVAGDLLIAFIGVSAPAVPVAVNTPSGWTLIRTDNITIAGGGAAEAQVRSFYRIADGTEGSTFTFTFTATASEIGTQVHRINGTHATVPIDANAGDTLLATALDPDPSAPAVTSVASNCLILAYLFHSHLALAHTHTPPANHTERLDNTGGGGTTRWAHTMADRVFATAGSHAAVEFNCTETAATDAIMQRISIAPGTLTLAA